MIDIEQLKTHVQIMLKSADGFNIPRIIRSAHPLFESEVKVVHTTEDYLVITRASLNFVGKTYKPYSQHNSKFKCFQVSMDLTPGMYEILKEDSTEDVIVINLLPATLI